MRYYRIVVSDPVSGNVLVPSTTTNYGATSWGGPAFVESKDAYASTYSSLLPNTNIAQRGSTNMAALRVEMDITVTYAHVADAKAKPYIKIWGVPVSAINQAAYLNNMNIAIYGGQAAGLPLASAAVGQAGLLHSGSVYQCLGNWQNTEQSLCFFLTSGGVATSYPLAQIGATSGAVAQPVTLNSPASLLFNWQQGQSLMDALVNTLSSAFPKTSIFGQISPQLVWSSQQPKVGYFPTLDVFAVFINNLSKAVLAGPFPYDGTYQQPFNTSPNTSNSKKQQYQGVSISLEGGVFQVLDGSTPTTPKTIAFQDIVGQVTWGQPGMAQMITQMRGDIGVGDYVLLPPMPFNVLGATPQQASLSVFNPSFNGVFQVQRVRHAGDSRSAQGDAWVSIFDMSAADDSGALDRLPPVYDAITGQTINPAKPPYGLPLGGAS